MISNHERQTTAQEFVYGLKRRKKKPLQVKEQ